MLRNTFFHIVFCVCTFLMCTSRVESGRVLRRVEDVEVYSTTDVESSIVDQINEDTITWPLYQKLFPNIDLNSKSEFHFLENLRYVREHNSGNFSFRMGITQFMHLSDIEWKSMFHNMTSHLEMQKIETSDIFEAAVGATPSSWDWRDHGASTPVKDQRQRGTCFQNSATETIETAWYIKSGNLLVLSVEQGADCSKLNHCNNGGLPDYSYKYAMRTQQCSDAEYPYDTSKQAESTCPTCKTCTGVVPLLSGYTDIKDGDETGMLSAVLINSLAIGIKADDKQFQMYTSGVLDYDCDNSTNSIDHAVVIEGYGTENGKDYWLVRNSWGTSWGDKGYIKMARGKCLCGLCHMSSYPKF